MADAKSEVFPSPVPSTPGSTPSESPTPAQIDSRRAQQLLERALILSEHGDAPAAILACRQAITLAPDVPQGYSMLGLLLEHAGDPTAAIAAYEKVLQIDPSSVLERESLARLRAAAAGRRTARNLFVFDEGELFDERPESAAATDAASQQIAAAPVAHNGHPSAPASPTSASPAPASHGVFPRAVTSAKDSAAKAPVTDGVSPASQSAPSPVPAAASIAASTPLAARFPSSATQPASAVRLGTAPAAIEEFGAPPSVWQRMKARPSYYFRGLPLALTTLAGLCFLLWARNYAASQEAATTLSGSSTTTSIQQDTSNPGVPESGTAANPMANPTEANPATANPNATAAPGAPNAGTPNNAVPANPGSPVTSTPAPGVSTSAPSPRAPAVAPAPPRASSGNNGSDGGAMPDLPRPRLGGSGNNNNTEPTRVVPSDGEDDGAASTGGSPLNPGGAPNRDFTRVAPTGSRSTAPARPDARAARDVRSAASGNAGAVAAATRAIEAGGGDTAMRYQQRAQLYLDSGDNTRAINDFQTAISAYNDMIARGDRPAVARAGIQVSQRGIQVARARSGR
jgi:tetratricopeptide (TPR) repeat protein